MGAPMKKPRRCAGCGDTLPCVREDADCLVAFRHRRRAHARQLDHLMAALGVTRERAAYLLDRPSDLRRLLAKKEIAA